MPWPSDQTFPLAGVVGRWRTPSVDPGSSHWGMALFVLASPAVGAVSPLHRSWGRSESLLRSLQQHFEFLALSKRFQVVVFLGMLKALSRAKVPGTFHTSQQGQRLLYELFGSSFVQSRACSSQRVNTGQVVDVARRQRLLCRERLGG